MNNIIKDFYTNRAKKYNFRSRSWFKLYEIDKKENIFKKNSNIVDLGSYPGGWSQYISNNIKNVNIFACDIYQMNKIKNVKFLCGNIKDNYIYYKFINLIKSYNINYVNVILSDMCPKISGYKEIDIPKMNNLYNISIKLCLDILIKNGHFVLKLFENKNINIIINKIKNLFKYIKIFKPNSSKKKSNEFYIIAKFFKK